MLISVENKGVEPLTPCVQGRCSKPTELIPHVSIGNPIVCSPKHYCLVGHFLVPRTLHKCVVPGRVELPTSTLSVWRSNQLSYRTG